ncbi:MAG TPA: glycosyltransferase family 2 protein [Candidatus Binatia bacterium]|nr:glycosyltransferase family 2 protein [Candidatus Binatia bacterium]
MSSAVGSVSAFFPCFNDALTIGALVESVDRTLAELGIDHEVIVVDDGSSDDSAATLDRLRASVPALRVVRHDHNRGYGAALRSGFAAATREWVFYTDGDGQYDPTEVRSLLARAGPDVDVVQGWKIERHDPMARRIVGRVYHHAVKRLFGLGVRDTDCDFRLIRRSLLERAHLRHSSGVICVEMLRKFRDAGARIAEVPVHHYPRPHGRSQFFRFARVTRSLVDVARLWVSMVVLGRGVA